MATTYLNRSVTGNNNSVGKWTFSCWVKRTELGNTTHLFNFYTDNSNRGGLRFNSDDTILYYEQVSNTTAVSINTNAVFRDTSAWYHIVLEVDKTISSPDTKIYVNGTSQTFQTDSDYTQNESTIVNSNTNLYINSENGSTNIRDQILTHIHFIDGTAYDASAFGQTDATTGIWKPKVSPSVTYGTNGFFLKFANSGSMGTDSSGNGNNFTVGAGTLTQTQDTPSNVFCTLNPLMPQTYTFSNGNNTILRAGGTAQSTAIGTLSVSKGKWYWEVKLVSGQSSYPRVGVFLNEGQDNHILTNYLGGGGNNSSKWWGSGGGTQKYGSGTSDINTSFASYTNGDILQFAMDLDNGKMWYGKNGTWYTNTTTTTTASAIGDGSATAAHTDLGTGSFWSPAVFGNAGADVWSTNFGNGYFGTTAVSSANSDDAGLGLFEYAPPTGYYSLCTKNINTYG